MSRRSVAHEVVHVSAVRVLVVVADPPTVSRRTFCSISRVTHALFQDAARAAGRHPPMDRHTRYEVVPLIHPFLSYLYLLQRLPQMSSMTDPSNPRPLELDCALDVVSTHMTLLRALCSVSHCPHSTIVAV
eukprot:4445000-Pleurochrysis_carterae.AAC.1